MIKSSAPATKKELLAIFNLKGIAAKECPPSFSPAPSSSSSPLCPVGGIWIQGFYRNLEITLIPSGPSPKDGFLARGRYRNLGEIHSFDDLVRLNFREWITYRLEGYPQPEGAWAKDMLRLGLVKRQVIETLEPA